MTVRMNLFFATILFGSLWSSSCSYETEKENNVMPMLVISPAFASNQPIPQQYTGQGDDVSPPLQWSGAPPQTKCFALICEDPDAPLGTFIHWVMFNIPPAQVVLGENVAKTGSLKDGSRQGKNSFGNIGYNGPMPPPGKPHRYYFKVYALDTTLDLGAGVGKKDLLHAMKGHVLAEGELMGTYQRK